MNRYNGRFFAQLFFILLCSQEKIVGLSTDPQEYQQWKKRHQAQEIEKKSFFPHQLITPDRFDLMAKYIYASIRECGADTSWGVELYAAHLKVWGNYTERFPYKNGLSDFITTFDRLLDDIKEHGFNVALSCIPIHSDSLMLLNGSHRVVASLLYHPNKKISCALIKNMLQFPSSFNADYFRERTQYVSTGLLDIYQDAMALEYVKLKKNTFAVCLYDCARPKNDQIVRLLKQYASIVYAKDFILMHNGPRNFTTMVYDGESWIKVPEYLRYHIDYCFEKKYNKWPMRVFIIETDFPEKLVECKQKIRDVVGLGKRSVHINDTHEETIRIAQSVLNQNSIHFLNYASGSILPKFEHYLANYKEWLLSASVNTDCFCIDSSAVLAAYGLRDCRDLDFLQCGYDAILPKCVGIESHNKAAHHYLVKKDDIIFNPQYHFYYKGVKWASLEVVRCMKEQRNELKDQRDVRLIDLINHID